MLWVRRTAWNLKLKLLTTRRRMMMAAFAGSAVLVMLWYILAFWFDYDVSSVFTGNRWPPWSVYRPTACPTFDRTRNWLDIPGSVYVIHHAPLADRRAVLTTALDAQQLTAPAVQWVTRVSDASRDDTEDTQRLDAMWRDPTVHMTSPERYETVYRATEPSWRLRAHPNHEITLPAQRFLALGLKHRVAYQRMLNTPGVEHALVLEDDVSFREFPTPASSPALGRGFKSRLFDEYWSQLPCDYDLLFLGSMWDSPGSAFHNPVVGDQRVYRRRSTRTTDAYVVSRKGAQRILEVLLPITMAIDWQLNWVIAQQKLVVYWASPPLIDQGSHTGKFKTAL